MGKVSTMSTMSTFMMSCSFQVFGRSTTVALSTHPGSIVLYGFAIAIPVCIDPNWRGNISGRVRRPLRAPLTFPVLLSTSALLEFIVFLFHVQNMGLQFIHQPVTRFLSSSSIELVRFFYNVLLSASFPTAFQLFRHLSGGPDQLSEKVPVTHVGSSLRRDGRERSSRATSSTWWAWRSGTASSSWTSTWWTSASTRLKTVGRESNSSGANSFKGWEEMLEYPGAWFPMEETIGFKIS